MSPLEKVGVTVIVVVSLLAVAAIAWSLLRPSRVPERLIEWKTTSGRDDGRQRDAYEALLRAAELPDPGAPYVWGSGHNINVRNQQSEMPPLGRPIVANYSSGASTWPSRPSYGGYRRGQEPVREAFRHMLEGGPDYRGHA